MLGVKLGILGICTCLLGLCFSTNNALAFAGGAIGFLLALIGCFHSDHR